MFSNRYLAYEQLSPGLKQVAENLNVVYPVPNLVVEQGTPAGAVSHPLVKVHPETRRKTLFISQRASHFEGWTKSESAPLINLLCDIATQPELFYRHQWAVGDLLIWDNRCTLHKALRDYDKQQIRYMRRTAVKGVPSGQIVEIH